MMARWRHSWLMYCTSATSISRVHFLEAFCACRTSMQAHLGVGTGGEGQSEAGCTGMTVEFLLQSLVLSSWSTLRRQPRLPGCFLVPVPLLMGKALSKEASQAHWREWECYSLLGGGTKHPPMSHSRELAAAREGEGGAHSSISLQCVTKLSSP